MLLWMGLALYPNKELTVLSKHSGWVWVRRFTVEREQREKKAEKGKGKQGKEKRESKGTIKMGGM